MKTRAVILAGGEGSRLGVLTDRRAKPAVPFAGKYRIIDFTLSNCVNSGIVDVMVVTQYRPHSLLEHVGAGRSWDLDRGFTGGVQIYQPYRGRADTDWYKGTADAITQNLSFVERGEPELVLVLSGDHIYKMNYAPLIEFHAARQAVEVALELQEGDEVEVHFRLGAGYFAAAKTRTSRFSRAPSRSFSTSRS